MVYSLHPNVKITMGWHLCLFIPHSQKKLSHNLLGVMCVYLKKVYAALRLRRFQFPSTDNNSDDEYV